MVNLNKLKGLLKENGYTYDKLADAMNITKRTIATRMTDGKFSVPQASKLIEILHLDKETANSIFFNGLIF